LARYVIELSGDFSHTVRKYLARRDRLRIDEVGDDYVASEFLEPLLSDVYSKLKQNGSASNKPRVYVDRSPG
jgi:hypothetical protein